MARKFIYVKMTEDYAGHKKDEVVKIRNKVPQHMEDYVDKATENMYTKYVKEQEAAKREQAKAGEPQANQIQQGVAHETITDDEVLDRPVTYGDEASSKKQKK